MSAWRHVIHLCDPKWDAKYSAIILPSLLPSRITLHLRIANRVVEDSYCRGGIVHIRCGYSCERSVRRHCPKALWRFRASASNSLNGRNWPHTHTHIHNIYQIFARVDIRVYEDDHCEPRELQYPNSNGL
jgi:hypothetical protein